jgi:hypothetical protein
MRPRIVYRAQVNNQVSNISEQEADVRLHLGAVPEWDTPVVDLTSSEIIFKCILRPQEEEQIVR